jgi:hypothetical protein
MKLFILATLLVVHRVPDISQMGKKSGQRNENDLQRRAKGKMARLQESLPCGLWRDKSIQVHGILRGFSPDFIIQEDGEVHDDPDVTADRLGRWRRQRSKFSSRNTQRPQRAGYSFKILGILGGSLIPFPLSLSKPKSLYW